MTDIYLGEYGRVIYINTDYDCSSAQSVFVKFSASAGTYSATCSVLASNVTSSAGEVYSANKAVEWVIANDAFSATGADNFVAWVEATFPSSKLISSTFKFKVSNPGDPW